MRPLKMRGWDTEKGGWIDLAASFAKGGLAFQEVKDKTPYILDLSILNDRIAWTQFTGLTDRNGLEMWEGDIVEQRNGIEMVLGRYEIRWGHFGFTMFDPKEPDIKNRYVSTEMLQVIGNVFQDKELIE